MNNPRQQQCSADLKALLENQVSEFESLDAYMTKIKTSIAENDIESLNDYLSEQIQPGTEILTFDQQRQQLLTRYHYTGDLDGLEKCIQWCDADQSLTALYKRFTQSLDSLQKSIQINSLLVNKSQDRVRRSLGLLTGQSNNENSRTYSSDGRSNLQGSLRSIGHV